MKLKEEDRLTASLVLFLSPVDLEINSKKHWPVNHMPMLFLHYGFSSHWLIVGQCEMKRESVPPQSVLPKDQAKELWMPGLENTRLNIILFSLPGVCEQDYESIAVPPSSVSGVTTFSLSLACSLWNWVILDYEEANGLTIRPWAPFLLGRWLNLFIRKMKRTTQRRRIQFTTFYFLDSSFLSLSRTHSIFHGLFSLKIECWIQSVSASETDVWPIPNTLDH